MIFPVMMLIWLLIQVENHEKCVTQYSQVEKSRTRIVDFDSSSDEEKEEDEDKGDNSKWREEVEYSIS